MTSRIECYQTGVFSEAGITDLHSPYVDNQSIFTRMTTHYLQYITNVVL